MSFGEIMENERAIKQLWKNNKENEWTWQNGKITEVVAAMCKTLSQSKHHYYVENCLAKFHSEPTSCSLISLKAACLICFLAFTAKRIFDENYISMRSSKVHLTIVIHTENNCISTEYYVAITWEFSVTFSFSPFNSWSRWQHQQLYILKEIKIWNYTASCKTLVFLNALRIPRTYPLGEWLLL